MSRIQFCLTAVALAAAMGAGAAFAQTPASPPATKPAPAAAAQTPSTPSTATQVETWTNKQWAAAQKQWAKNKEKWADCRRQSSDRKLTGRKSWSFLYTCMTN
jgi:hypothetical protein